MNDQFEIFKRLREYEVKPPEEVRLRIFNTLEVDFKNEENAFAVLRLEQLQELEITPPTSIYAIIEQKAITAFQLSFLKSYQVAPPADAYSSILKKIGTENSLKKTGAGTIIRTIYRYRAAVAIILIAITGWFTYNLVTVPVKSFKETVNNNNTKPADTIKDTIQSKGGNDVNKSIAVTSARKKRIHKKQEVETKEQTITMSIDDYKFSVKDNDLLATFASFEYQKLPPFISNEEQKSFSVRIDQYTAIYVSEPMTKMIRKMNQYRRNGKLKARAKKTRERLEKWKAADSEQFDSSLINNPLDPLDLAEFIFK